MAIAYKWRIDNNRIAYITDENGGEPFVYSNLSGNTRQKGLEFEPEPCVGMPSEKAIEIAVNNLDESGYTHNFDLLRSLLYSYYGYNIAEGDNYNTEAYYWPENEYNKTALDVEPNLTIVGAEEAPSLTAKLIGTDSTKKIKLDIEMPAGYDGFSCYLSPDSLTFVKEDILDETGTTSASTEVMLFRGDEKLEPYSIEVEQSYEDDEIIVDGSVITIKPHIEVVPPNNSRVIYNLRGAIEEDAGGNTTTSTIAPQTTTTTTTSPIDTTTSTRKREKIEVSDRKIWVYVTYRWREYGSNEFVYFVTKLLLRYNILTYDLIEASKNGTLNTENYDTKERFVKAMSDLQSKVETLFSIDANGVRLKATDTERKASAEIVASAGVIEIELTDGINKTDSKLRLAADGYKETLQNTETGKINKLQRTAAGKVQEFIDESSNIRSKFTQNAGEITETYYNEVNGSTAQVTKSLAGVVETITGYCEGLTSLFARLDSGVVGFVEDDIAGYVSKFAFGAAEMLLAVSSIAGSYSGIKATAAEVDRVVSDGETVSQIIQTASGYCIEVTGIIGNLNNEIQRKKSSIVQRPSGITISSDNIKLEGETTFNGGFKILEDGTAVINNGFLVGHSQSIVKDVTNDRLFVNCNTPITYPYNNGLSSITVAGFVTEDFTELSGGTTGIIDHFGDRIYEIPMCMEMAKYGENDENQTLLRLDEYGDIYASSGTPFSVYTINKKTPTSLLFDSKKLNSEASDKVQVFLPIDEEYVGMTVKIIVNNIGGIKEIWPVIRVGYTNNHGIYWVEKEGEKVWSSNNSDFSKNKVTPFVILGSASYGWKELLQLNPEHDDSETAYNTLKLGDTSAFTGSVELTAVPSTEISYTGRKDPFLPNGLPVRKPVVNGTAISFEEWGDSANKIDKTMLNCTASSENVKDIRLAKWVVTKIDTIEGDFKYKTTSDPI